MSKTISEQLDLFDPDSVQEITIPMGDFLQLSKSLEDQGRTILAWDCDWKRKLYTVHHVAKGRTNLGKMGRG